jgi:Concanavalin A-like lectin/glucanases superfamily/Abnormal spindle-like microcephaly-assoc'd, ASPM-SPD-2-Hydin/Secretion system C-terminal sorting domain
MIAASIWYAPLLRGQDCTRNMLTITTPGSYVATPGALALNLTKGFTIECWAKVNAEATGAALVDKVDYGIFLNNDSIFYGMVHHTTAFQDYTTPVDSFQNWHHFAFVFTPGDSMRFYVDTIEVSSEAAPFASIDSNSDSLRIGMSWAGVGFTGSMDELRIWNTPRSLANIQQTMYQVLSGNDPALVLYYSFDDDIGSRRIHDFSNHSRDGYIRGANAEIAPSSSPMQNGSPGFALATVEKNIIIPTLRCASSFDTVVHVRNLGPTPLLVDTVDFRLGVAFSIVPNSSFTLPADSNIVDSLRLHFEPDEGGVFDDSLYIASPSICGGRIVIGLHAAYDSVGLTSNPVTLNFGALTQCQLPTARSITLTNTSVTDSVTILSFLPPSDTGLKVLASFPIHLAPRQDTLITVQLTGGNRGPVNVALGFELNKCSRQTMVNVTAVRDRAELSMPANVDFGAIPAALGGVTRDTTIVVTNTGDVTNAISAIGAAPDTILEILDGRTGILKAPGDTLQARVRMLAATCGLVTAILKFKSYFCSVDTATTISITLAPPVPLTTPTLDMGISCQPRDTAIFVSNPGNLPVQLDTITFSANSIFENSPFFPLTIPAHDSVPVQLSFVPTLNGMFVDTAFLQMSPCGVGTAVFKGQLGFQGLSFTAPQLFFGRGCKTDSIAELDTLTNFTSDTVMLATNTYTGSLRFSISPFSFPVILPPGQSKVIWVTYSPTLGALDTGTFTFFSFAGCPAASFHLRGSREIAKAAWTNPSGEFNTICPGTSANKTFDLKDEGIDSIDVVSASVAGNAFTLVESPSTIGDSGQFRIEFTPNGIQNYSGLLTITVDSCETMFTLPLHGSGGPAPQITLTDTVHNFDSIAVGDFVTYCIAITNPSCQPITTMLDTSGFAGAPFKVTLMPNTTQLASGDTIYCCIQYTPATYGNVQASLRIIGDSIAPRTVTVLGVGLAPNVRFTTYPNPNLLDFGYVPVDSSKMMMIYDSNAGNLAAAIAAFNNVPVFGVQPPDSLAPRMGDSIAVTFNPVAGTGLVYDTLYLIWDGHTDSVILRGFGTEKGLQLSAVGLDFGNVHVGNDSTLSLSLFATNNFPTIDSISVFYTTPVPRDTFYDTASSRLPYTINNAQDTLTLQVTYYARLEQLDTDYLVIHSGTDSAVLLLTARGVEAHPHIISPDSIAFSGVLISTSAYYEPVQIKNEGGYPLNIDSIFTTDPAFVASAISPSEAIAPDSIRFDTVTFTPIQTRQVMATLSFRTSYHDSVLTVPLSGSGMYSTQSGPNFGYSVDSSIVEPGQNDSIPVTMNGTRLAQITDDSVTLDIRFDPQMVMVTGADGGASPNPVSRFTHLNDSTIEVSIPMSNFAGGTVMRLYTQALLGPHPISYIHVINSDPLADRAESATDGEFTVEDCGGLINGVVFAGPYSTNAIVPNPAGDNATLAFQVGWNAPVTLDFYNVIGQNVKHLDMGTMNTGAHTLTLDVSDLPQGRYVYRITSLDYYAEGALVILR